MIKKLTGYLFFLLLPTLLFSQNIQTVGEPADTLKQAHIRVDTTLHVYGNTILDGTLTMNTIATEQVKLGTGSDAAPELSSVADPNTGVRFPGGDKMQFVQNGINSHTWRPYRQTFTYSDGDTASHSQNGTNFLLNSTTPYWIYTGGLIALMINSGGTQSVTFNPTVDDSYDLGQAARRWRNIYSVDIWYHGGKGQTATQYISKENTIAGQDSSMMMRIGSDGNSYVRYTAADGDSARIHVRSDSTEIYSKNAIVFDAPAVLIGASNVGISKMDTVFTAGFVPRWVKFTSGAKSWYSPVYADTTGKW